MKEIGRSRSQRKERIGRSSCFSQKTSRERVQRRRKEIAIFRRK